MLATSRARLRVPFEMVFTVPGLSRDVEGGDGDAVALFVERAAMAGWSSPYPDDRRRIAAICDELDGIALAIELAAARLATFGLDGLEAGLADRLGLLAGGPRLDDRHRSVRSALDWSFGLLDEKDQVVLRRASVFAAPFTAAAAATVTGHAPLMPGEVAGALARLADHSLLVVVAGPGRDSLPDVGDDPAVRRGADGRGRRGIRGARAPPALVPGDRGPAAEPRASTVAGFDEVADDLRAGLGWAAGQPDLRVDAHELAVRLAELTFARGMPSEAQRRYEEAATLAADPAEAARRPAPRSGRGLGPARRATRRYGCTALRPRRRAGPATGGAPPSSSPPRPSSSAAHRASCPSWCLPGEATGPAGRGARPWRSAMPTSRRP